jgi:hypothetical protein
MKISDFNRCAFIGAAVVALLAGCGPSQSPIGGLGPTNTSRERTQKTSSGGDLIYAAPDFTTYEVNIFTYPAGKFVADFKPPGFPGGLCSDAHGNVFMTDFESGSTDVGNVDEYAHGATSPSATLDDDSYYPTGCSIDPTTGNLAVANEYNYENKSSGTPGNLAIYADAEGSPAYYETPCGMNYPYAAGYDGQGNLFILGNPYTNYILCELREGSSTFTTITLSGVPDAHALQWDGTHMAFLGGPQGQAKGSDPKVYRVKFSGSAGTVVGTTTFKDLLSRAGDGFAIQGKSVLMPAGREKSWRLGIWNYPAGGKATELIKSPEKYDRPLSVTVSVKPKD